MPSDSNPPKRKRKAKSERFPLTLHSHSGQWCKKVLGRVHYFGRDRDAALAEWLRVKDDLLAGRPRREDAPGRMTLSELCNRFLHSKRSDVETGYLRQKSWDDYKADCERMLKTLGREVPVDHLSESDFGKLRKALAKGVRFATLQGRIVRCRAVLRFGERRRLIGPVLYKLEDELRKPPKAALDRERGDAVKVFEADEVRLLLSNANAKMRCFILLAINCGMGNEDLARLTPASIDLDRGWITKRRQKTGRARRCPLWPETVEALRIVLESRGEVSASDPVFMTRWGKPFNSSSKANPISSEFRKLRLALGIDAKEKTFYTLRHSFKTVGLNATGNSFAVDFLMGHLDPSVSAIYLAYVTDERLREVTDAVRSWLFPPEEKPKAKAKRKQKPKGE